MAGSNGKVHIWDISSNAYVREAFRGRGLIPSTKSKSIEVSTEYLLYSGQRFSTNTSSLIRKQSRCQTIQMKMRVKMRTKKITWKKWKTIVEMMFNVC